MRTSTQCRLCRQKKFLIKAHIIPAGFYRPLKTEKTVPEIHTNIEGAFPQRSPVGIFDRNILCRECDALMGPWDQHAQNILLKDIPEESSIFHHRKRVAYQITKFDYKRLKLFFVSLLWRASISTHVFFKRISLGSQEEILRDMILNQRPGSLKSYPVTLARFENPAANGILDPHPEVFDDVKFCRFYLTGYVVYIQVDDKPPPSFLGDFAIKENEPITVIMRNFAESKDGALMLRIAQKAVIARRR